MKHTGRSAVALLLALLTAASLAGCGKTGGSGGASTGSGSVFSGKTAEPVLIRVAATRLEDGLIVSDTRYGYDESGNKTAEIDYQLGMLLKGYDSYEYEYGSNGLPTKRRAYTTVEGLTQLTAEETFDSSGNVSSRREYDITGDVVAEYTYDSDGNTTLKVSYINGNVSKTETTYYEDGSQMTNTGSTCPKRTGSAGARSKPEQKQTPTAMRRGMTIPLKRMSTARFCATALSTRPPASWISVRTT